MSGPPLEGVGSSESALVKVSVWVREVESGSESESASESERVSGEASWLPEPVG